MSDQSIKLGLALGLTTMGRWRGEPVAYLYNGVRLPKLPEWDRTVYPYAVIRVTSDGNYGLLIASAPFYFGENSLQFKGDGCGYQYKVADSMWTENGSFAIFADYTKLSGFTPIWGNHDVLSYEDDSLYIAKSAPISVYE